MRRWDNDYRMKVAILASFLSAHDARIAKQVSALRAHDHQVDLIAWVSDTGSYPTLQGADLLDWRVGATQRLGLSRLYSVVRGQSGLAQNRAIAAAKRAVLEARLKRAHYDVVIASDPETLLCAARAKTAGRYKLVYDAHEFYPNEVPGQPDRDAWVAKTHAASGKFIDAFITVNPEIGSLYEGASPQFPKAVIVQNASPLGPAVQNDGRLAAAAGLSITDRILLFQGGMVRGRGLEDLVRTSRLFPEPWRLVIMGSGILEAELRALALDTLTRFLPPAPLDELPVWTAGASMGAILYEPTCLNQTYCSPNKLWELPAAQVPILATDLPYLGQIVKDHGVGVVLQTNWQSADLVGCLSHLTDATHADMRAACTHFSATHHWGLEAIKFVGAIDRV